MQAFPSCVVQHGAGTVIITVYEYASVACVLVLFQVSRPLGLLFLHAEAINKLVEQDQARMRHLPSLEELGAKDVSLDQLLNSLSSSVVRKDLGTEAQVGDQVYACNNASSPHVACTRSTLSMHIGTDRPSRVARSRGLLASLCEWLHAVSRTIVFGIHERHMRVTP